VRVRVALQIVLESLDRQGVPALRVIGRRRVVELRGRGRRPSGGRSHDGRVGRGGGRGGRSAVRRRRAGGRAQAGEISLRFGDLLGELREAPVRVLELRLELFHLGRQLAQLYAHVGVRLEQLLRLLRDVRVPR